jgi:hypothetical protein
MSAFPPLRTFAERPLSTRSGHPASTDAFDRFTHYLVKTSFGGWLAGSSSQSYAAPSRRAGEQSLTRSEVVDLRCACRVHSEGPHRFGRNLKCRLRHDALLRPLP